MNFQTDQGYEATVKIFECLGLSINDKNPTAEPPASSQRLGPSHITYRNQSPPNSQGRYSSTQLPTTQAAANPEIVPISNFANSATASYTDRVPQATSQDSYPITPRHIMPTGNTGGLSSPAFPTHATISPGAEIRPTNSQSYQPPPVSHFAQVTTNTDRSISPNSVICSSNSYGNKARPGMPQDQYLSALRDMIPTAPTPNVLPSPELTTTWRGNQDQPIKSHNHGIPVSAGITYKGPNTIVIASPEFTTRATTPRENETRPTSSAPEPYRDRSSTAPLSLSQMLPPKRVLPFATKSTKPTTPTTPPAPTPNTETAIPSLAYELTTANTSPAKKIKISTKPVARTEALATDTRERVAENEQQQQEPAIGPNEGATDISSVAQTLSEASEPASTTVPPKAKTTSKARAKATPKPRKSAVPKSRTKSAAMGSPTRSSSLKQSLPASAREEGSQKVPSRNLFGDEIAPAEFMTRLDAWVREFQDLPAPKPREIIAGDINNLAAYAVQPREERMAIIDNMICECLGDENFVRLLEDVDQSWRRIGLGM